MTIPAVRVAAALAFMGDNAKILLTFGRYVPGLRFVVRTRRRAVAGETGTPSQ